MMQVRYYHVVYQHPLSEHQVVKATYERLCDADRRLNIIKKTERNSEHYRIVEDYLDNWPWQDSGIELGF